MNKLHVKKLYFQNKNNTKLIHDVIIDKFIWEIYYSSKLKLCKLGGVMGEPSATTGSGVTGWPDGMGRGLVEGGGGGA